jgi:hypothetical protein
MNGAPMTNLFTAHPASVGQTYAEHLSFALAFGLRMVLGGLAAIVHAVFPFVFITTASRTVDELNARRNRAGQLASGA